jgi:hypothetical protein
MRLGPRGGVYVPKRIWLSLDDFSADAIVLVCASRMFKDTRYWDLEG